MTARLTLTAPAHRAIVAGNESAMAAGSSILELSSLQDKKTEDEDGVHRCHCRGCLLLVDL